MKKRAVRPDTLTTFRAGAPLAPRTMRAGGESLGGNRFREPFDALRGAGRRPIASCFEKKWRAARVALPPLCWRRGRSAATERGDQGSGPRRSGDRGYSFPTLRRYLQARSVRAVIPSRKDLASQPRFDREAYRERNAVERLFGRLKAKRRLAT